MPKFHYERKNMNKILSSVLVAGILLTVGATSALAIGGPSGPKVVWQKQGKLGAVKVNPYGYAPLTAVITNDGYVLSNVSVTRIEETEKTRFAHI